MNERSSAQVGVDQSGSDAEFAGRDQQRQELDPVLHDDADGITQTQSCPLEEVGVTVGASVELSPGHGLTLADDGSQPTEVLGGAFDYRAETTLFIQRTGLHALLQRQQHRHVPQHRNDFANSHGGYSRSFIKPYIYATPVKRKELLSLGSGLECRIRTPLRDGRGVGSAAGVTHGVVPRRVKGCR